MKISRLFWVLVVVKVCMVTATVYLALKYAPDAIESISRAWHAGART